MFNDDIGGQIPYPGDFRNTSDFAQAASPLQVGNFQGRDKPVGVTLPLMLGYRRIWVYGARPSLRRPEPELRAESRVLLRRYTLIRQRQFHGILAPWAYLVTGLALAPIFPTGIVWLAKLRPGDSRATSWLFPAASIGGIAGPGAIGIVIAQAGVSWAPAVLAVVAIGMSITFFVAARRTAAQ